MSQQFYQVCCPVTFFFRFGKHAVKNVKKKIESETFAIVKNVK